MSVRSDTPTSMVPTWTLDLALVAFVAVPVVFGTIHMQAEAAADRDIDGFAVAAAVAAAAAMVVRRRWPWASFAVVMAAVAFYTARAYPGGPIYLPGAVALYGVARVSDRRVGYGVASVVGLVMFAISVIARRDAELNDLFFIGWPAVAVLAADAMRGRDERAVADRERRTHADEQREQELFRRLAEDRLRIARDLHDTVAHSMATINVQSGVAAHVLDRNPAQAGVALEAIRLASRDVQQELAAMVDVLRASDGAAPRHPTPDLSDLDTLVESARLAGVAVSVEVDGDIGAVTPAIGTAAYRIVQEALTNVSRHAATDRARVRVQARDGLAVEIVDEGRGPDPPTGDGGGRGLVGIRERAAITGGVAEVGPGSHGGFRVRATWAGHA